jgi:hypothetical protein
MRCAGYVALMVEMKNVYKIMVGNLKGCEGVDWI